MKRNQETAQTGYLTRMYLRRDRIAILIWLLGIVGGAASGASKIIGLTGNDKAVASLVHTMDTPAMAAMFGPFKATQSANTASIFSATMMVFMGLIMAVMNIYFAIRNTRTQEDNGVLEMVRAHSVGRQSSLLATLYELIIINLLNGVLMSVTLQAMNMDGADATGNWLFGMGLAACGLMFGAFTLLIAQLASNARGATTMSYSLLGILYILRALTDVQNTDYTWWTVFGWVEKLGVYGKNDWLPALYMIALAAIVLVITFVVSAQRDLGSGLLPDRPGRAHASVFLAGPTSLIFRLERTSLIAWVIGLFIYGASMGSLFDTIGDMMNSSPMVVKIIGPAAAQAAGRTMTLEFASMMATVMAIGASVPVIATLLRLNSDEQKGWLESMHARPVSRFQLFGAYSLVATVSGLLTLFAGNIGMAIGSQGMKHAFSVGRLMRAFWGFAPAILMTVGIAAVVVGLLPRLQKLAWILPIYALLSIYLGGLLDFPEWTKKVTPFGWIRKVPLHTVQWDQVGLLVVVSCVLVLIGYSLYRRRDLIEN
jgi:ABC-2 type transport system permease protein